MSATSTKLPKLERLLLDGDINAELEPLLMVVGFRTTWARQVNVNIRNDTSIVRWARRHRHIVLCHDKHKDRKTNQYLYPEIYHRGGKVIRIGGDSSQHPLTALGKLLAHREEWRAFFAQHDGIVTVHRTQVRLQDSRELYTYVQKQMPLTKDPAGTLRKRKAPRERGPRRPSPVRAGARLL